MSYGTAVAVVHPLSLGAVEARAWVRALIELLGGLRPSGFCLTKGLDRGGPKLALYVVLTGGERDVVTGARRAFSNVE